VTTVIISQRFVNWILFPSSDRVGAICWPLVVLVSDLDSNNTEMPGIRLAVCDGQPREMCLGYWPSIGPSVTDEDPHSKLTVAICREHEI
jgi:hypothetical protein